MQQWKEEARSLYFDYGLTISEVAMAVGKSRKCVSAFLNTWTEEMNKEKEERKDRSAEKRRNNNREQMRKRRQSNSYIDGVLLRRDHENAVRVLSAEKFFGE